MDKYRKSIIDSLKKITGEEINETDIEIPPNSEMGDYAFPCFNLAKKLKKNPVQIAKELSEKIKPDQNIRQAKSIGPYLNFFINKTSLSKELLLKIFSEKENYCRGKNRNETGISPSI